MRTGFMIVFTAVCLFLLAGCSKDKGTNGDLPPSQPTPAEETWNFSGDVSGSVTVSRDANGALSASGVLVTTAGDSIVITSSSVTVTKESVQLTLAGQNGAAACSLAVVGSALEGAGSGTVFIDFKGAQANVSGTWTADLQSGSGITATAATLTAGVRTQPPSQGGMERYGYTATFDTIYFTMSYSDTSRYCAGDSMVVRIENENTSFSMGYEISGDNLTIALLLSQMVGQNVFDDPSADVAFNMHFTRKGTGSGLIGQWEGTGTTYEIISGTLTLDEIQDVAEMAADFGIGAVEVTASELIFTESSGGGQTYSWADDFIEGWNYGGSQSYSAMYDITVSKISDVCVMLEGNRNGEVVIIYYTYDYSWTYISSVYDHPRHVYYENPGSCPNDYQPNWFYAFLSGNSRGGIPKPLKKAVVLKPRTALFPSWPLR